MQQSEGVENIPVRQAIGFSRSRDSGRGSYSVTHHSKSGGQRSTPSLGMHNSSSRSRPSFEYAQEKAGEVSLKFANSNHDEVNDAMHDNNFAEPPSASEMLNPGAGFQSKRSAKSSKYAAFLNV